MTSNTGGRYMGRGRGGQFRGFRGMEGGGGRGGHWQGRGRGNNQGPYSNQKNVKSRPTHFLCLPLHTHADLRRRISAFQAALFDDHDHSRASTSRIEDILSSRQVQYSSLVEGLDSTIVIDPVRMHMTLGVMALEDEDEGNAFGRNPDGGLQPVVPSSLHTPAVQRKTVSTALNILMSLSPQISEILKGSKVVKVPLEVLDVLKAEKMRPQDQSGPQFGRAPRPDKGDGIGHMKGKERQKDNVYDNVGAGVLFIGPRDVRNNLMDEDRRKLMAVCELVHRTFKDHGYVTDNRPLKLHCTILNTSHRRTARGRPFSYTDIRGSRACGLLHAERPVGVHLDPLQVPGASPHQGVTVPSPMPINLGSWDVHKVELWKMGSRDTEGKYISCGGIRLGV